jgi:hypothetical protein
LDREWWEVDRPGRPKAGNDTWLLQVKLTFQFPD